MNIETGKYYKTRNGRKAYIRTNTYVKGLKEPDFPMDGPIGNASCSWTKNGRYIDEENESKHDLIEEWKD